MQVRRFIEDDVQQVCNLMEKTIRISNNEQYNSDEMKEVIALIRPESIIKKASWTHFYVVCDDNHIIGTGAIGSLWGKTDVSTLYNIFIDPDYQGKGIGKMLLDCLENDEYGKRAKRIEVPASVSGVPFYMSLGYRFKNGKEQTDSEGLIPMEKII